MNFDVQMSWLQARISTLKYKDNRTNAENTDLEALEAIMEGYETAQRRNSILSWQVSEFARHDG